MIGGFGPMMGMGLPALSGSQIPSLQSAFENMGRYQDMIGQLAQGGNLAQLMGGMAGNIMDPSTLVPGLGMGANDQPVHPGMEAFQRFSQLQMSHQDQRAGVERGLEEDLEFAKERLFANNHYQTDDNGALVMGDDGRPILVEGAENGGQRLQRLQWERAQKHQAEARNGAEAQAFRARSEQVLADLRAQGNNLDREQYLRTVEALTAEEQAMAARHHREVLGSTVQGLPDPEIAGRPLSARIDDGVAQLQQLQAQHTAVEMSTPEGQAIQAYMDQMNAFIAQQRQQLAAYNTDQFDPNAMRNLRFT